jgi:hypothetical protein
VVRAGTPDLASLTAVLSDGSPFVAGAGVLAPDVGPIGTLIIDGPVAVDWPAPR